MTEIKVHIPARAEFVHVLRSVVAGVAARHDLSVDDIEDLRLAVGEACAYLLAGPVRGGAELKMSVLRTDQSLEIVTSLKQEDGARPPADARQTVMWNILAALADEARLDDNGSGPAISLTKVLPRR